MSIRKDYTTDVLRLLDNLKAQAEKPRSFLGITFGYNRDDLSIQIDKIRASMPRDLKDAASLTRESERLIEDANLSAETLLAQSKREADSILTAAHLEADRLVETARLQQESMTADSEILKLARSQSEEIRNAAEREAMEMRRGADKYAYEVLQKLQDSVDRVAIAVQNGRQQLEPIMDRAVVRQDARDKSRT